jgi:hypothetical protein
MFFGALKCVNAWKTVISLPLILPWCRPCFALLYISRVTGLLRLSPV